MTFKNALVSVSDKTGLIEFLKPLVESGLRVVSTGGTALFLESHNIKVIQVSEQTGFPEVMDGRVKTLHPHIHMALLARANKSEDTQVLNSFSVEPFDLVIGNLYPFESNPGIETIDIGGPSFLRSAAKNFERVTVVCDTNDYQKILNSKELTREDRKLLASKVFAHTAAYDSMITEWLASDFQSKAHHAIGGIYHSGLRYGENPMQKATWFRQAGVSCGLQNSKILQGKELSYNNILDLTAAIETLQEFDSNSACIGVKHNNPCGAGVAASIKDAVQLAMSSDPVSIFGGIVAINKTLDAESAKILSEIFLECIVAPEFSAEAQQILSKKKNLRLLQLPTLMQRNNLPQYRQVYGGYLVQTPDQIESKFNSNWAVYGQAPDLSIQNDLLMALKIVSHLKSNAIAVVSSGQTLGLGMGQVNRVDAVAHAIERMRAHHSTKLNDSTTKVVLASDAFFPFPDSIEKIAQAGIKWVVQPGGSVNDEAVINKARELGVNMILTGARHFLH